MKDVFVEIPFAKIEFATEAGGLTIYQQNQITSNNMDLDIISINTQRDVGQDDCPTFSITLVYKEDWYKQVGPNDFVQITLGRGKNNSVVMCGLVDNVYKSWSFVDLKPTRSITISGRGLNKAIIQFGIGAVQEVNFSFQSIGFFEGQNEGFSQTTPARLIKTVFEYYLEKGINIGFSNGKKLTDYINTIYQENPDEELTLGDTMGYYSYQGGLWDYIKELRNAPFYEAFWEIIDDKPTFIVRPTPFNPDNWTKLLMTQIDDRDVINEELGRTDLETYTVYAVKGESVVSTLNNIFGLPIWYEPFYEKYGLRRLQVQSKYIKQDEMPVSEDVIFGEVQFGGGNGGSLAYPIDKKYKITSRFGRRKKVTSLDTGDHKGIDFGAPLGTPIYSAEAGVVKLVSYDKWRGHYIDIQHGNGIVTRYQHCSVRPPLPAGTKVQRGQVIAQVGATGDSKGTHLHFEVHINGYAVDPEPYITGSKALSSKGGKGGSNPLHNPPISSIDWEINENKSFEEEYTAKKQYDEEILGEKQDLFTDSSSLGENLINNYPTLVAVKNSAIKETKQNQDEANRYDTINVSQKTIDLFNWNIKNNMMENGSLVLKGRAYQIGTRLYMHSTNMEYYIEKVLHSFTYNENWTTTLEVTRGLPLGERFKKPWNEWSIITSEDLIRITGISQTHMNKSNPSTGGGVSGDTTGGTTGGTVIGPIAGLRGKLQSIAKSKEGIPYSQDMRMSENYADCSSFVYKVTMEALGKNWKGTRAPSTGEMHKSKLWREIPLSEVQPWDILWRKGHTEFLGDNGRTYGAHQPGQPAGAGGKYSSKKWSKAYRVNGM